MNRATTVLRFRMFIVGTGQTSHNMQCLHTKDERKIKQNAKRTKKTEKKQQKHFHFKLEVNSKATFNWATNNASW